MYIKYICVISEFEDGSLFSDSPLGTMLIKHGKLLSRLKCLNKMTHSHLKENHFSLNCLKCVYMGIDQPTVKKNGWDWISVSHGQWHMSVKGTGIAPVSAVPFHASLRKETEFNKAANVDWQPSLSNDVIWRDVTSAEFCVQFWALFHGQDH